MTAPDASEASAPAGPPLVVDLDGTLIRADTFFESMLAFLAAKPWGLFLLMAWLARGRAHAKARLAAYAPAAEDLPYDERVLDWLRAEKAKGRVIALATASDRAAAEKIAAHVGLFDIVFASDGRTNLKSAQKAAALKAAFPQGFAYAGNERADLNVWAAAEEAVVANAGAGLARRARAAFTVTREFAREERAWPALLEALRPRQWTKNLLVFAPILAGQGWSDGAGMLAAGLAFLAFCAAASALYLVNDAFDIAADRRHPRKRARPLARGALSPAKALAAAAALGAGGALLGAAAGVLGWALGYMALSGVYTLWLKRLAVIDVFVLAGLYALRVVAGGEAADYPASSWLIAFCGFFFLSLALAKRVTELESAPENARRGYRRADGPALKAMGVAAAFASSLVLALYVQSDVAAANYAAPALLWALPAAAVFWLCRVWLLTGRGEMHDDPVVFASRDRVSLIAGMLTALAFAAAALWR